MSQIVLLHPDAAWSQTQVRQAGCLWSTTVVTQAASSTNRPPTLICQTLRTPATMMARNYTKPFSDLEDVTGFVIVLPFQSDGSSPGNSQLSVLIHPSNNLSVQAEWIFTSKTTRR